MKINFARFSSPIGVSLISIHYWKNDAKTEVNVFVPYRGLFNFNQSTGFDGRNLDFCFRPLSGSL